MTHYAKNEIYVLTRIQRQRFGSILVYSYHIRLISPLAVFMHQSSLCTSENINILVEPDTIWDSELITFLSVD